MPYFSARCSTVSPHVCELGGLIGEWNVVHLLQDDAQMERTPAEANPVERWLSASRVTLRYVYVLGNQKSISGHVRASILEFEKG
jgi:hypothetical protein